MREVLDGKVAIITGGGSGIGFAIAQRFVSLGATPVIVGRNQESLDEAVTKLGRDARAVVADVSNDDDVRALFEKEERVDILVTCAGGAIFGPIEKVTPEDVRTLFATRVFGQMSVAHFAVPRMKQGGTIIFCSGVGDVVGLVPYSAGSAVDGAVNALARSLAVELGGRGIRVNAVSPGVIGGTGIRPAKGTEYVEDFVARAMRTVPLARPGSAEDVADAAGYLATSFYVTGQVIEIDGGWSAV